MAAELIRPRMERINFTSESARVGEAVCRQLAETGFMKTAPISPGFFERLEKEKALSSRHETRCLFYVDAGKLDQTVVAARATQH